ERVFLEQTADNHDGMRAHDVHHNISTETSEVVDTDHGVWGGCDVGPRLVLDQSFHSGSVFERPFHMCHEANPVVALLQAVLVDVADDREGPILVEGSSAQMCVEPIAKIELSGFLRRFHINSGRPQSLNVIVPTPGIDDVNGLFATFEALLDKWQEQAVLVVVGVKEPTNVPMRPQNRLAKPNLRLVHGCSCDLDRHKDRAGDTSRSPSSQLVAYVTLRCQGPNPCSETRGRRVRPAP